LKSILRKVIPNIFPHTIEKCAIAHHEAGHAVASYLLQLPVSTVSIAQQDDYRGYVDYPIEWRDNVFKKKWEKITLNGKNELNYFLVI
jgi:hypothetical protein